MPGTDSLGGEIRINGNSCPKKTTTNVRYFPMSHLRLGRMSFLELLHSYNYCSIEHSKIGNHEIHFEMFYMLQQIKQTFHKSNMHSW